MSPATTDMTKPHADLSTPATSLNMTGVRITVPRIVIPMATQVPLCSAAARLPPPGFTKNDPMIEAPIPSVAIISG